MEYLRGRVSGLAIPAYVVDAPGGGGKIPVLPNYIVTTSPTHTVLRNFEGVLVAYPEPGATVEAVPAWQLPADPTVYELVTGQATKIQPAHSARQTRRDQHAECPQEVNEPA